MVPAPWEKAGGTGRAGGSRAGSRSSWYCKSCSKPDSSGFRRYNFEDRLSCKWCGLSKSTQFDGKPPATCPSKRVAKAAAGVGVAAKDKRIQQLEAQVAELQKSQAGAAGGGHSAGQQVFGDAGASSTAAPKARLAQVDAHLANLQHVEDPDGVAWRKKLEAEQVVLRKQIFEARPADQQLRAWNDRVKKQEKQLDKGRLELQALVEQQEKLKLQEQTLRQQLVENEANLEQLKRERQAAVGALPGPPPERGAGLGASVPGFDVSVEQLGQLLGVLGVDQGAKDLVLEKARAREAEEAAARAKRATEAAEAEEAQKNQGGAATAADVPMEPTVEEMREQLQAAGCAAPPADDEAVRAAYKRAAEAFLGMAKKQRVGRGPGVNDDGAKA